MPPFPALRRPSQETSLSYNEMLFQKREEVTLYEEGEPKAHVLILLPLKILLKPKGFDTAVPVLVSMGLHSSCSGGSGRMENKGHTDRSVSAYRRYQL